MTITILGRRWLLQFCRLDDEGVCDPPTEPNKRIRINKKLCGEEKLATLLHEMMHAAAWHVDESYIAEASEDMAKVLWRLGYRDN